MACSKKGKAICYGFDIALVILTVVATVMFFVIPDNPYFSIGFVLAPFVYLILLGVNFYVDILIFKKGKKR